jgi:hypothetical protein
MRLLMIPPSQNRAIAPMNPPIPTIKNLFMLSNQSAPSWTFCVLVLILFFLGIHAGDMAPRQVSLSGVIICPGIEGTAVKGELLRLPL